MRLGVKFSRTGETRFVSHLDMQRLFSRALRRAALPVKYSQGFNPHIVTSFASALSVGAETFGDYMEFYLTEDMDTQEVRSRLNAAMPEGIEILKVGVMEDKAPKLMAASKAALIEVRSQDNAAIMKGLLHILSLESFMSLKKSKGNMREFDLRPLFYGAQMEEDSILLTLAHSGSGSLPPHVLIKEAAAIAGYTGGYRAIRLDLLIEADGELVSMGSLMKE